MGHLWSVTHSLPALWTLLESTWLFLTGAVVSAWPLLLLDFAAGEIRSKDTSNERIDLHRSYGYRMQGIVQNIVCWLKVGCRIATTHTSEKRARPKRFERASRVARLQLSYNIQPQTQRVLMIQIQMGNVRTIESRLTAADLGYHTEGSYAGLKILRPLRNPSAKSR